MDRVKKIINYWCKDTEGKTCLGRGITAAVLDTGISPHPDLKGRIRGFQDLVHHRRDIYDDMEPMWRASCWETGGCREES